MQCPGEKPPLIRRGNETAAGSRFAACDRPVCARYVAEIGPRGAGCFGPRSGAKGIASGAVRVRALIGSCGEERALCLAAEERVGADSRCPGLAWYGLYFGGCEWRPGYSGGITVSVVM